MAAKKVNKQAPTIKDPIGPYLDDREVKKYGPRIVGNEAQYMPGDMSKANKVYKESGFAVRSTLEQLKSFMGGGLRKGAK